jgi:DNA-binding transcriptional MerR regulator
MLHENRAAARHLGPALLDTRVKRFLRSTTTVSQPQQNGVHAESADDGALLTTGEMARRSNNTLRTVRFYEEEGILRPVRRTDGGHRLFDKPELEKLMLVTDMRAAGLSLDEIKHILEIKQSAPTGGDAARKAIEVLTGRIADLKEKLLVLQRLQEDLQQATEIMTGCVHCDEPHAPGRCAACPSMTQHTTLPRSLRVLWSTQPTQAGPTGDKP